MTDARPAPRKIRRRPGLRIIMLVAGLFILAMPVSGLYLFRIYENELVRQTETELIAQGALVGAMAKDGLLRLGGPGYGRKISGHRLPADERFLEVPPRLDLTRDDILPRGLSFRPSPYEPDSLALSMGAELENVLREARRTNLSSVYVLDYRGVVVAGETGHGLSLADNIEVAEALNGLYYSVLRERGSTRWVSLSSLSRGAGFRVFCALPVMHEDRLVAVIHLSRTPRETLKALYLEGRNVAWAALLSLGLIILVSAIVWKMIIVPVKRLDKEAKEVAEGRRPGFDPQAPRIVVRELAELRTVVADMAERLRRRSDYLKAFASGVSHEFKTPLTAIKGAMELLGEHGRSMSPETRARFESNILADLDRLERLVGRLLTLARAEAQVEEPGKDGRVEAGALVRNLAEHYQSQGYAVEIDASAPHKLELAAPADMLETVLRNLFDNSRDAGATRSFVEMEINPVNKTGEIYVTDNGPGIPDELLDSIFKPFFTTRPNQGGTGLGLSLARTLLAPYRGELHLLESESGAAFIITLPTRA